MCVRVCTCVCVCVCVRAHKRTVPYNLPLLFIATNSSLLTPNRLITPRSTVEISIRPKRNTTLGKHRQRLTATGDKVEETGLCSSDGCNLAGALRLDDAPSAQLAPFFFFFFWEHSPIWALRRPVSVVYSVRSGVWVRVLLQRDAG